MSELAISRRHVLGCADVLFSDMFSETRHGSVWFAANISCRVETNTCSFDVPLVSSQMLTVLRAENWPAFDQSELEVLERQVLDEAVEVFGEPVEQGKQVT